MKPSALAWCENCEDTVRTHYSGRQPCPTCGLDLTVFGNLPPYPPSDSAPDAP